MGFHARARRLPLGMALLVACLLAVDGSVSAAPEVVVFDNGTPDGEGGVLSDLDPLQLAAEDFTLTVDRQVNAIRFWGVYAFGAPPPSQGDFSVAFYESDASGSAPDPRRPVAILELGDVPREATGTSVDGFEIFRFDGRFDPVLLSAGRPYWVSVSDRTVGLLDDFYWATSGHAGTSARSLEGGFPWVPVDGVDLAVQLLFLPEPSAGLGAAGALATLGILCRRRRTG
jgi:hypothetical protein